jgi:hypothetical protein
MADPAGSERPGTWLGVRVPQEFGYWAGAVGATAAWSGAVFLAGNYPTGVHLTLTTLPLMGAVWGHAMGFSRGGPRVEPEVPNSTIPPASMVVRAPVPPRQGPPPAGLPRWRVMADDVPGSAPA